MMASPRSMFVVLITVGLLVVCPAAVAAPPAAGTQAGSPVSAAASVGKKKQSSTFCEVAGPVVGGLVPWIGELVGATPSVCETAGKAVGGLAGEAVSAAGNGIMNALASWMIGAASTITSFVSREMQQTTTPQLQSAWYEAQFAPMADLGAALGLLVALIALASAAIRRSPEALAGTLAGIMRAGLGTSLAVALTVIGLEVSDQISNAVLSGSPHTFWGTVAHAWGTSGFGGFGSSALAMFIALIEVFAGVFVWLELIVRNAAIYIAVMFFPAVLAASIWPALSSWTARLARLLMLFVILKPVALIVLSLAGNAAAAGLSFGNGIPSSVGTILAATVIFALAAFAPWALMYLLAADAESAYMAAGMRTAASAATTDQNGRSVRSGGGLRNLKSQDGASGAGGGRPPGGSGGSPGGEGSGGTGGGGGPFGGGGPVAGGEGVAGVAGNGAGDGALAVGGETTAAGSIAVAAGAGAQARTASVQDSQSPVARAQSAQDHASLSSASEDEGSATAGASRARPAPHVSAAQDDESSSAGALARAPAENRSHDTSDLAERERPATSRSTGADAPRPPADTVRTLPRSPRRGAPRRSPALSGAGTGRPNPQPREDGER